MNNKYEALLGEYGKTKIQYHTLIEQKFSPQNLMEYNEILFSAHSCAIEGNSFSVNDTKELKEHGIGLKLQNKSIFEAFEILDHFKAFEFLMNNLHKPVTEQLLIDTHRLLTQNTIEYSKGYKPGTYTTTQMMAGETIFPDHEESIKRLPALMEQTQKALNENKVSAIEISAKFHQFFIYLHPFPDGNGRIGRLFSNFILAKKQEPLLIIPQSKKNDYINALMLTHKHNNTDIICSFFIETSITRMKSEMQQKDIPINHNKAKGFEMGD